MNDGLPRGCAAQLAPRDILIPASPGDEAQLEVSFRSFVRSNSLDSTEQSDKEVRRMDSMCVSRLVFIAGTADW